ncbi:hypothetical protein ACIPY0_00005, partial [Paenarthrobacter nicotinovorans]|uniref:hypothetical protein n=1 Tax=Paenarthrobacter nicotinovorans TaxID=29320 RepID=UPI00380147F6
MAIKKVPSLNGLGKLFDKYFPDRLQETALNATYARYARPIGGDDTSEFQGRVNEAAATGEP